MDHNQTNEPSGPRETHDGDETGQINDEGQPNNDEFKTKESMKEQKPKPRQDPLKQELNHQDSKILLYKFPLWSNTQNQHPITLPPRQSKVDHSLFIYEASSIIVVVLIYMDDVIITGNNLTKIQETNKQLDDEFIIKDLGLLKYFLGIEEAKTKDSLVLSQQKHTLDTLENSGKIGCKLSVFPIEHGLKLDKRECESQFIADPRNDHSEAVNRALGYLNATSGQGILISRAGEPFLTAYCDCDFRMSLYEAITY
ncbi:uncharacterized mitochondrial protein-like protein [Tanacetum coccineum]